MVLGSPLKLKRRSGRPLIRRKKLRKEQGGAVVILLGNDHHAEPDILFLFHPGISPETGG